MKHRMETTKISKSKSKSHRVVYKPFELTEAGKEKRPKIAFNQIQFISNEKKNEPERLTLKTHALNSQLENNPRKTEKKNTHTTKRNQNMSKAISGKKLQNT